MTWASCARGRDVETVVFDHHRGENPERPPFVKGENWVLSDDGAQATSMLHILREREVEISRLQATIFALGIHEDTGSLTYPRTTIRDAEMLAALHAPGRVAGPDRALSAQRAHQGAAGRAHADGRRGAGGAGAGARHPRGRRWRSRPTSTA